VPLVAILDADKEGFLRSHRSLTQTVGRAARNLNGTVIMYADKITDSMRLTIEETERRRSIQLAYNEEHGITPTQIVKAHKAILGIENEDLLPVSRGNSTKTGRSNVKAEPAILYKNEYTTSVNLAADPIIPYMNADELGRSIERMKIEMMEAAKQMDFMEAARLRDEIIKMEQHLQTLDK
jgi:excinuclease ABC subunit B